MSADILNYSSLDKVVFFVAGDEYLEKTAAVQVFTTDKFNDRVPIQDGLYDARMGTISPNYNCGTCKQLNTKCVGHFGRYLLSYPLVQNIYAKYIPKNMNIICNRCYRYVMDPYMKYQDGSYVYADHPIHRRSRSDLSESTDIDSTERGENKDVDVSISGYNDIINYIHHNKTKKSTKPVYCDYCNQTERYLANNANLKSFNPTFIQPNYQKVKFDSKNEERIIVLEERTEFRDESKGYVSNKKLKDINEYAVLMFPEDFKRRFEMVPESEMILHGIPVQTHPKNFIIRQLPIPPVNMRHPNRNKNETYNDFMTSAVESIIIGDRLIENVSYHDASQFSMQLKRIADIATKYANYINSGTVDDQEVASITDNIKGKKGVIRDRCLGKLVSRVFRCVITCNIENEIDVIDLPLSFAMIMHFQETVTAYNIRRLQTYVDNNELYPGCNRIKMISRGHKPVRNNGLHQLQLGDIVSRNIINGDVLPITRFPSLFVTSTVNVYIKVHNNDKENNAVGMNVILCAFINGDFDGDTVSGFYSTSEAGRAEYDLLGNIRRNITSGIDGTIIIGQAQDTIAGCGFLTMESTKFDIMQVKAILNGIPLNIPLENRTYEGRELFSMVMPRISLERESPFFKNELVKYYYKYDEKDRIVKIVDGKLISGIVCDALIKIQKKDTIYHIIYNYYGPNIALKTVRYHQIMIKNFLRIFGVTLDYNSFQLTDQSKEMIRIIRSTVIYRVNEILTKLVDGKITPPSGVHIYDYVEQLIKAEFRGIGNKYVGAILADPDIGENWLVKMCLMGSKGSFDNIEKILVSVGQVYLDQKRTPFLLDFFRTAIWSQQFSLSPESRGFVNASLMDGYSLQDLYSLAREARNNIIIKGLVTAEAGTEGRNVIKNSESLVVDNRLFVSRENGAHILQFSAGNDCMDSKQLFKSRYNLFDKTEKYIRENFHKSLIEKLINERNEFIENCLLKERNNFSYESSANVLSPLNMPQIISIILGDESNKPSDKHYGGDQDDQSLYDEDSYYDSRFDNFNELTYEDDGSYYGGSDRQDDLVKTINDYCDKLHYKRFSGSFVEHVKSINKEFPALFTHAFNTMRIVVRSTFDNGVMLRIMKTTNPPIALETVLAKISNQIIVNMAEAGLAYGINISLTLTSPFTQYLIDAHHASASGGSSRDDIKQFKSIIYLKSSDKMHSRRTYIFLKAEYEDNYDYALRLANYVETQYLREYIFEIRGLCEAVGSFTTFPADEVEIKKSIASLGYGNRQFKNFYYRIIMLKDKMISKNVDINMFIDKINDMFNGEISCVYYTNGDKYILYMLLSREFNFEVQDRKNRTRSDDALNRAVEFARYLNNSFIINDFKDLNNVKVIPLKRSIIKDGVVEKRTIYYIEAEGINLQDIYLINVVDKSRTFCNNISTMYQYCGYLEARNRIVDILNGIFTASLDLMVTNYIMVADIMMELGRPVGLTVSGLSERESNDRIITAAYKNPTDSFLSAATDGLSNIISSPSSSLIMGQMPRMGSYYNYLIRNPEFKIEMDDVEDIL
jgi:DNA-directed RNA polymerase II subunit RPB1